MLWVELSRVQDLPRKCTSWCVRGDVLSLVWCSLSKGVWHRYLWPWHTRPNAILRHLTHLRRHIVAPRNSNRPTMLPESWIVSLSWDLWGGRLVSLRIDGCGASYLKLLWNTCGWNVWYRILWEMMGQLCWFCICSGNLWGWKTSGWKRVRPLWPGKRASTMQTGIWKHRTSGEIGVSWEALQFLWEFLSSDVRGNRWTYWLKTGWSRSRNFLSSFLYKFGRLSFSNLPMVSIQKSVLGIFTYTHI